MQWDTILKYEYGMRIWNANMEYDFGMQTNFHLVNLIHWFSPLPSSFPFASMEYFCGLDHERVP